MKIKMKNMSFAAFAFGSWWKEIYSLGVDFVVDNDNDNDDDNDDDDDV